MKSVIGCLVVYLIIEMVMAFIFSAIAQLFYKKNGIDFRSVMKGVIERIFLSVALLNGYTQSLTFFSALKLATRLRHSTIQGDEDKFNDYYLLGNLISVLMAFGYVRLYAVLPGYIEAHF
jgi:hypothetical protein